MIELERCSVRRDGAVVVREVTTTVHPGESLAVIGPNGGGKSTLLAGIRGLLSCDGSVRLVGDEVSRLARPEIARRVAVVPQRTEFAFPYRVDEMVLFGRAPYRRPWEAFSKADRQTVSDVLAELGLEAVAHRRVDTLSGGERRKVFLARALAQSTPILLLDEPTAGLDPAAQEEFVSILDRLRRAGDRTIVVVVHDVRMAQRTGDRILGLRDGAVLFDGAPAEVLHVDGLEALYGVAWDRLTSGEETVFVPRGSGGASSASLETR